MRILFFVLLSICFFAKAKATTLDSISIHLRIDETKNILHVTETYHFPKNEPIPAWQRIVFHNGIEDYPLLYQRLENVVLKDKEGNILSLNQDGYGQERTRLQFEQEGVNGSMQLSYDVLYAFNRTPDFLFELRFYDFGILAHQVRIVMELPSGITLKRSKWDVNYHNGSKEGDFEFQNDLEMSKIAFNLNEKKPELAPQFYELRILQQEHHDGLFEPVLKGFFVFEQDILLEAPYTYKGEWQHQGNWLILVVLIGFLLAIVLRFFPPSIYPAAIRAYGLLVFVLMIYTNYPLCVYSWKQAADDSFFMELGFQIIFVGAFVLMAKDIHQNLLQQNYKAYYGVLAFPTLLLFLIAMASVSPIIFMLLPLAFSPLIFWFQPKNANYLGATYYQLIEQVETAGKLSFEELSQKSNLSINRLIAIIKNIPHHPILIDHKARVFMTADAVALQQKYQLCTNCGAATTIENEDLVQCHYCNTSYQDNYQKKVSKPIPEIVEITAQIAENLARIMYLFGTVVIVAIVVDLFFNGFSELLIDLVIIVIFGGLFAKIGMIFSEEAGQLRTGEHDFAKIFLIPLFVFVTPILIFYKFLKSKRVQLHFDEQAIYRIGAFVKKEGTTTISDLAKHLSISPKEALEIADYLCGNNLIEVVFDVQKNQLVHRSVWEKLKGENSCKSCGGLVKMKGNEKECMYCGEN